MKGDFILESLKFEKPTMLLLDADIIITDLLCLKDPKYKLTPRKRKNGMLEAQKIPLEKVASQMASFRFELTDIPSSRKVELKRQLEIICAGFYLSKTALLSARVSEDDEPLEKDQIPTADFVSTTTDSQPHPTNPSLLAKISPPGSPHTPSISLPYTPCSSTAPK